MSQTHTHRSRSRFQVLANCARIIALAALGSTAARAEAVAAEYELKAAVLAVLGRYIEWPPATRWEDPATPLTICVLGKDVFGAALDDAIGDKKLRERNVSLKRTRSAGDAARCHIVFISSSESGRAAELVRVLQASQTVIVSDAQPFAAAGGHICLKMDQKRVRFEIDAEALAKKGLKVSSQLLKLAKIVRNGAA